jgi:hypothetical protein
MFSPSENPTSRELLLVGNHFRVAASSARRSPTSCCSLRTHALSIAGSSQMARGAWYGFTLAVASGKRLLGLLYNVDTELPHPHHHHHHPHKR